MCLTQLGFFVPYVETVFQTELLFSISSLFGLKFSLKYDHDDKRLLNLYLN